MLLAFGIFDEKAGAYHSPLFYPSRGVALRELQVALRNPQHPLAQFPSDYKVYELGEFDPKSGSMFWNNEPVFVVNVADLVEKGDA